MLHNIVAVKNEWVYKIFNKLFICVAVSVLRS